MRRFGVFCLGFCALASLWGCARSGKTARVDYAASKGPIISSEKSGEAMMTTCPVGMVIIPGGPSLYGPTEEKDARRNDKDPAQRLTMKAFCVDKFEYPNAQGEPPMRSVNWLEAKDLCVAKGKRLCTEYEFEKACRGPSGTLYTYGDGYAEGACPAASADYGIGQFSNCVSGFGAQDMGGGVYEWTSSGPEGAGDNGEKYLRGGLTAETATISSRCTYRGRMKGNMSGREIGFRCCASTLKEEMSK